MIEHDVAYGLEKAIELAPNDGCPITLTIGECESLVTRLRQAEKDAARYRWLRDPSVDVSMAIDKRTAFNPPSDDGITGGYFDYEYRSGSELDDSIDEAMQCNK